MATKRGTIRVEIPEGSILQYLDPQKRRTLIREIQNLAKQNAQEEIVRPWKGQVAVDTGKLKRRLGSPNPRAKASRLSVTGFVAFRIRTKFWLFFQSNWPRLRADLEAKAPIIVRNATRQALAARGLLRPRYRS